MADDTDILSSPWAQLLIPLASAAAGAISPRYGGAAVQGGLGAIGALQNYKLENARLQELRRNQQDDEDWKKLAMAHYKPSQGAPNAGPVPGAQQASQSLATEAATNGGSNQETAAGPPKATDVPHPGEDFPGVTPTDWQEVGMMGRKAGLERLSALTQAYQSRERKWTPEAISGLNFSGFPAGSKVTLPMESGSFEYSHRAPTSPFEAGMEQPGANWEDVQRKVTAAETKPTGDEQNLAAFKKLHPEMNDVQATLGWTTAKARAGQLPPQVSAEDQRVLQENPGMSFTDLAQFKKTGITPGQLKRTAAALINPDIDSLVSMKDVVGRGATTKAQLYDEAAQQAAAKGIKFSPRETDRKLNTLDDFSATGKDGLALQQVGTLLEHASGAADAYAQLNRTNFPLVNMGMSKFAKSGISDPNYNAFVGSYAPVKAELSKYLTAPFAPSVEEQKNIDGALMDDASPAAMMAGLQAAAHVAKAKFTEQNFRYKRTIGDDIRNPFSSEATESARKLGVDMTPADYGQKPGGKPVAAGGGQLLSKSGRPIKPNPNGAGYVYAD